MSIVIAIVLILLLLGTLSRISQHQATTTFLEYRAGGSDFGHHVGEHLYLRQRLGALEALATPPPPLWTPLGPVVAPVPAAVPADLTPPPLTDWGPWNNWGDTR